MIAIKEIDEGLCLRCKDPISAESMFVKMGSYPQLLFWALCQDCWNELVLMDSVQREKTVFAVYASGESFEVRGW